MKTMRPSFREIIATLLVALVIFLGVQATLESRIVLGQSMEPSFYTNERVMVIKASYWFGDPQRGDVIVFNPVDPQEEDDLIKRVIALPGEEVEVRDGQVYITDVNGETFPLDEPYIREEPSYTYGPIVLLEDEYFVLGDNRNHSADSHVWGVLPGENIIGKTWLIYWPLSEWQLMPSYSYAQD
jgi:signal peptidase I